MSGNFLSKMFGKIGEDRTNSVEPPEAEGIIISCYFNPTGSPYRIKCFNKFYEGIKHLNHKIVECVIGDVEPDLPPEIEKVYTKHLLWHKETLLNNIIRNLPPKYKYIFWVDADVIFTNPNWMREGVEVMRAGANILQPFEYCIHLERDEFTPNFNVDEFRKGTLKLEGRHPKLYRSFASNRQNPKIKNDTNYAVQGHVGFAWGVVREKLEQMPGMLYDKALIGGGDHLMAQAAATGKITDDGVKQLFKDELDKVNEWADDFYKVMKGKIGYVKGDLYHIWHGDSKNRRIRERTEFMSQVKKITKRDENGLYVVEDEKDADYMGMHFSVRDKINDDSDNNVKSGESAAESAPDESGK